MKIDAEQIINETLAVFEKSDAAALYRKSTKFVETPIYHDLHKDFLTPLDIKIDHEKFNQDIKLYEKYFQRWGRNHQDLERYGLALVNQDGILKQDDPVNGSLMEWNKNNPKNPIIETDCVNPTEVLNIDSLKPLSVFNDYWCRSNVLKWHRNAFFYPHIDTVVPSMWLRLWATLTSDIDVRFYNEKTSNLESVQNIELGRLYLIDTSKIHDAIATNDNTYQLFLSVSSDACSILKSLISCQA